MRLRSGCRCAHAFTYPGAPPQQCAIAINGSALPPQTIGPAWQVVEFVTRAGAWHAGVNRVALQFAWAARPADVGAGGDRRQLAAAVDSVRIEAGDGSR